MDAYSAPSHDSLAASEARKPEPLGPPAANRHRLPVERPAITHHFAVGGHEGYLTVGLYPNGQPGEIFIRMAKEGSTIAGLMECFGTVVSVSLQHGVPLRVLCDKLSHTRFEPSGWTGSAELGYTRTGRRFFNEISLEREFLERIRDAADRSSLWEELGTDWMCLDCELMPWSIKAQELLTSQYAPVGAAGTQVLSSAIALLAAATTRADTLQELAKRTEERLESLAKYREAYRHYCWPVRSIGDLKLAPFHLLATEGSVHTDKGHGWHMEKLAKLCSEDEQLLLATPFKIVDVNDTASCDQATKWWRTLTSVGGEGMVVKPLDFISKDRRGYAQPAVKCRGPEYLRIIYGPEYLIPENLERLRSRGLGAKRSLASREFALGIEALERFVRKEPLRRTHECVFGVLALECEPVDPRL